MDHEIIIPFKSIPRSTKKLSQKLQNLIHLNKGTQISTKYKGMSY